MGSAENLPVSLMELYKFYAYRFIITLKLSDMELYILKNTFSLDVSIYITGKSKNLAKISKNL
jgi:hypothetical protein